MPGTNSRLTTLELRKQLLLAESEVNRMQLLLEWQTLASETRELADRCRSACSAVSSLASLGMAGFKMVRDWRSERATKTGGRKSWLSTLINGVTLGARMWKSMRP